MPVAGGSAGGVDHMFAGVLARAAKAKPEELVYKPFPGGADVVAVTYVAGSQVVQVGGGDNRGKAVRQVNVVRRIIRLGDWTGRPALFDLPATGVGAESMVILVQGRTDRRILAAAIPD